MAVDSQSWWTCKASEGSVDALNIAQMMTLDLILHPSAMCAFNKRLVSVRVRPQGGWADHVFVRIEYADRVCSYILGPNGGIQRKTTVTP